MRGRILRTGMSLLGGSVGQPGVGSTTEDFEKLLKGALEVEVYPYVSCVKGTRWEGPFLGTLEGR